MRPISTPSQSNLLVKKMGDVLPQDVAKKFETYISLVLEKEQMMSFKYELALPHGLVFLKQE